MKRFTRDAIRTHCVDAEWPEFLGEVALSESFVVETDRLNAANGPIAVTGVGVAQDIAIHVERIEIEGPYEAPNGGPFVEGSGPPVPARA